MQSSLARTVFHPADDPLLSYQTEDGKSIEPDWYMPILPLVLLNGVEGIGTGEHHEHDMYSVADLSIGWSTSVPNYNPVDVVANLKRLMAGEEQVPMLPWWRGFTVSCYLCIYSSISHFIFRVKLRRLGITSTKCMGVRSASMLKQLIFPNFPFIDGRKISKASWKLYAARKEMDH